MTQSKHEIIDDLRAAASANLRAESGLRSSGQWLPRLAMAAASCAVLGAALSIAHRFGHRFNGAHPTLFVGFVASVLLVLWGVSVENRTALFLATLFGVPLNGPKFAGHRGAVSGERARWLARFLRETPRGLNTVGAHLACGVIATKRELKALCVREERGQPTITASKKERKALLEARRQVSQRAARLLAAGHPGARVCSRRAHRLSSNIESLDAHLFQLRLDIQREVVAEFMVHWRALYAAGEISNEIFHDVAEQFRQPEAEPEALLPNGLVPSRTAHLFEYGMFFGRAALAAAFIATFDTSSMAWSILLLLLSLYVIEPVVQKLYLSSFNLLLDSPGHKLVDLKRYLETNLPAGKVFRVPITVPKFSSNPARSNLQAIIDAALSRCSISPLKISPFSLRDGVLNTVIEFGDGEETDRLKATKAALEGELARNIARLPLSTEVTLSGSQIVIRLLDEPAKIWELVGEDANQAFTYLKRNLEGLKDSMAYLGPKFQPVFVFVSNTKDPDVIQYEQDHVLELQRRSDREFAGQVGFLYLLRGGAWYNFNARLDCFDADDKDFVRALPEFFRRLAEDEFPARDYVLGLLGESRSAQDLSQAFNRALRDGRFHEQFSDFDFASLPPQLRPTDETEALLSRARAGLPLDSQQRLDLNRELLLSVLPAKIKGDFFKKVGNDIAVHELIVAGKTRPTVYLARDRGEHVQDPNQPNFVRAEGDFARYTGLEGSNELIRSAILRGLELQVSEVPEVGAIIDDKNEFGPGELEKGIAIMLHPENRHIVIGVPRINVTLPEHNGSTMASDFILGSGSARDCHNAADSRSKACVFGFSSVAYGKWLHRPRPYLAHYAREVLNPAHALSHDFQQSYFVAGAAGRLGGFCEALYGPTRVHAEKQPSRELAWAENEKLRLLGWRALRNQALAYARGHQAFLATGASRGSS